MFLLIIDLHTHTYPKSDDSFIDINDLVVEARSRGLDGICVTEHDSFWPQDEITAISVKHNFLVIPGAEINTDSGHVLVFGLDKYIFGMHNPEFLQKVVETAGGVMIAAHPYRRRFLEEPALQPGAHEEMLQKALLDSFLPQCNGVEIANGRGSSAENRFSKEIALKLGKSGTGGSDSHRLNQVGTVGTSFHNKINNVSDLISEIRSGFFEPIIL